MTLQRTAWVGVFAHPDDEWVAGWPVFQDPGASRGVLFVVGDNRSTGTAPRAVWEPALRGVVESQGITYLGSLGLRPDFYRAARSERSLLPEALTRTLEATLTGEFADAALVTHNPGGEYGHPDHQCVFQAMLRAGGRRALHFTDLCYEAPMTQLERR